MASVFSWPFIYLILCPPFPCSPCCFSEQLKILIIAPAHGLITWYHYLVILCSCLCLFALFVALPSSPSFPLSPGTQIPANSSSTLSKKRPPPPPPGHKRTLSDPPTPISHSLMCKGAILWSSCSYSCLCSCPLVEKQLIMVFDFCV